jgi:flagellar protein FlbD
MEIQGMIKLTKVDGNEFYVNADEIETVESSYDTTISLKSGKKIIVKDRPEDIRAKVIEYKKLCFVNILNKTF